MPRRDYYSGGLFGPRHEFSSKGRQSPSPNPNPQPESELAERLRKADDGDLLSFTHGELAALAAIKTGSVSFRLAADNLRPAIARSRVYRAGEVRRWVAQQHQKIEAMVRRAQQVARGTQRTRPENQLVAFRRKWGSRLGLNSKQGKTR